MAWNRNPTPEQLAGTKKIEAKKKLNDRLRELCEEQGVDPAANLSEADVQAFMRLTHAEKNMINLIARGYPVRNANAILRAVEMKLDRSAPRPQQSQGEAQGVTVTINTLAGEPPSVTTTTHGEIPAVKN